GEGGHSEAFLNAGAEQVIAQDRDGEALTRYQTEGPLRKDARLELHHGRMSRFSVAANRRQFDGMLVDLGPSTRQLLSGERGFSFSRMGPIDMRMDASDPASLAERLSHTSTTELARALEENGEIYPGQKWADRILEAFRLGRLKTTSDLAALAG